MMRKTFVGVLIALLALPSLAVAASATGAADGGQQVAPYARLLVGLSLLSFIPAALVAMTSFTRIIVTLSFLRHALGMPETPPNLVLITLAMLLTFFTMAPTLEQGYQEGVAPFLEGKIETSEALERGLTPLKSFMSAHVRDQDLQSVSELARVPEAAEQQDTPLRVLAPAFMLSELRAAFVAGFMIFLPFLLIDLLVAAILMALGMMMVPPASISLPLKVMLFVLIDGWSLLLRALAGIYA
ncbi:MAG TPA: flagellar type III secretion system pore protein FliP [Steroidobacteraceae bacterium]|nr:flagellar type III secretion system pore protein FliP [Steroidobacteraceae bacterium]